jgi:AGZA family xanthine/uracil permease-like MFS transporter
MFIVVFAVMLPIKLQTGDPIKAWEAGLTWVALQSLVLILGGFLGPFVRRVTPRAALLRHTGRRLDHVHLDASGARDVPHAGHRPHLLRDSSRELVRWCALTSADYQPDSSRRCLAGTAIRLDLDVPQSRLRRPSRLRGVTESITHFGFSLPIPALDHVFSGFSFIGLLLVTAIPFGLYDLIEALDNVERCVGGGRQLSDNARALRGRRPSA